MIKWLKKYDAAYKIFALLLAVVLWFLIIIIANPSVKKDIGDVGVTLRGENALKNNTGFTVINGFEFASGPEGKRFDVKLKGPRNELLNLKKEEVEIIADVSEITQPGENLINCSVYINNRSETVEVRNLEELQVVVVVDEYLDGESVELTVKTEGTPAEGYEKGEVDRQLTAGSVFVRGPRFEVSRIRGAVATVNIDGAAGNVETDVPVKFTDAAGYELELKYTAAVTETEQIKVFINAVREIPLRVNLTSGGGLTDGDVEFEILPGSIMCSGQPENFVSSISLGSIDLNNIDPETQEYRTSEMIILPNEYLRSKTSTATANIIVTVKDITTREFLCEAELIGEISGGIELEPEKVSVILRGNSRLLAGMTPQDIRVTVDLSSLEEISPGKLTLHPSMITVEVQNGYRAAVDDKPVFVNLYEPTEIN